MAEIRKGQRYRARDPIPVIAMTSWNAPFTGGHHATLPAGEEFVIDINPIHGATAVYVEVVNYNDLHPHFIPVADRTAEHYSGYYLCIDLELIRNHCDTISDVGQAPA